jgi:hypothetical protein
MNNFTRFCLRCGAWDAKTNSCNHKECTFNSVWLIKEKMQGFQCKLQRFEYNQRVNND